MKFKRIGLIYSLSLIFWSSFSMAQNSHFISTLAKINEMAKIAPDKALASLDSFSKIAKNISLLEKIKLQQTYAFCHFYNSNYSQAEHYFKLSLNDSKKTNDSIIISKAYNNLGVLNRVKGNLNNALQYYDSSLIIKLLIKDTLDLSTAYMNLANVYNEKGFYTTATRYYYKALNIFTNQKKEKEIATTLLNIGVCEVNRQKYVVAEKTLNQSLSLFKKLNDQNGQLIALNNLGTSLMSQNKYPQAKLIFKKIVHQASFVKDSNSIAFAYMNMGELYLNQHQLDSAVNYFRITKNYFKQVEQQNQFLKSNFYYNYILYNQHPTNQTLNNMDSCFNALKRSKNYTTLLEIGDAYLSVLEKSKNYNKTVEVLKELRKLQLKMYNDNQLQLTNDIEVNYKFEQQLKRIKEIEDKRNALKMENTLQKYRFNLYLVVSISILFLLLAILILSIIKQKNKSEIQKNAIMSKNRELTRLALHISEKKEFLLSLKKDLKNASSKEDIKGVYIRIHQYLNSDIESFEFQKEVDEFLANFRKNLEKHPQLTLKDHRLCTLIYLGLTTKEIAVIFNISTKGVEMQRYRLRKKFDIPSELPLEDWLKNL